MCYNGRGMSEIAVEGLEYVSAQPVWVVPNRVDLEVLAAIETALGGRDKIAWVIDRAMPPSREVGSYLRERGAIGAHLRQRPDSRQENAAYSIRMLLEQGRHVVLLPGRTAQAGGLLTDIPAEVLHFLDDIGMSAVPLYVGMFNNSVAGGCTSEAPHDMVRLRFCRPLTAGPQLAERLRRAWMEADADYLSAHPLIDRADLTEQLVRAICRRPEACIIDGVDDSRMRYDEVLRLALTLAEYLRKCVSTRRLGIILPPGKPATIANLACLLAGISPVNINYRAGAEQFRRTCSVARISRFLTERRFPDMHRDFPWPYGRDLLFVDEILNARRSSLSRFLSSRRALNPERILKSLWRKAPGADDEALLMFTGGAFAPPLAVPHTHRMVLAAAMQMHARLGLPEGARVLAGQPLYTPAGLHTGLLLPLLCGYDMVTYTSYTMYERLGELAAEYHTSLSLSHPGFALNLMKQKNGTAGAGISRFLVEGEPLPPDLLRQAAGSYKTVLLPAYSMAESTSLISCCMPTPAPAEGQGITRCGCPGSTGMLLPGMAARITEDAEGTKPTPAGAPGLLHLRGANVFRGYSGQAPRTGAWFCTDDIARFAPDGSLVILGRKCRFSRVNGELISHADLEDALYRIFNIDRMESRRSLAIVGLEMGADRPDFIFLISTLPQHKVITQNEIIALRYALRNEGFSLNWVPHRILGARSIPTLQDGSLDYLTCVQNIRAIQEQSN